jgi:probable rRNA maturation factor
LFFSKDGGIAFLIILEKNIVGLSAASLDRFLRRARKATHLHGRVNLLLTGNAEMRALNRQFRRKDKPTDVLSFPSDTQGNGKYVGEIAISADIASDNAGRLGHATPVEVKILALHGILHLAGFDHESDNGKMARKEAALRRKLGLPLSLTERGAPKDQQPAGPKRFSGSRGTRRKA